MGFVELALHKSEDTVAAFFIMTIDQSKISASKIPFASIEKYTAIKGEQEILFSTHTVFRADEIKQALDNNRLWQIQLAFTDDNDPQLGDLMKCIRDETQETTEWHRIGKLMLRMGHFKQAEEFCNQLLNNSSSDSDTESIYHMLGGMKHTKGEYKEAVKFFEKALEIKRKTVPEDDPSLANTYTGIGLLYNNMGDYSKALEYYEKAHQISERALPLRHSNLASFYACIDGVYNAMGDYSKALECYRKAHQISEIVLAQNHPSLANSYKNIGTTHYDLGDYTAALKALQNTDEIQQKVFQEGNPAFSFTCGWLGRVYRSMQDYPKTLSYCEKLVSAAPLRLKCGTRICSSASSY
ncbi:unnamed protein product [Rotaria sp. Silwood2]|nr:unnamed protein product [Rotaria sp. Silwood2]CAF3192080.1 unnamed protein product [Rotaria sp. Silwood2]CAF3465670.1 unnamed protein product [Rotaria sp. Silwood2]CAF4600689.1 unnamed protein product [Rotaria sp. Silwood2]